MVKICLPQYFCKVMCAKYINFNQYRLETNRWFCTICPRGTEKFKYFKNIYHDDQSTISMRWIYGKW